MSYYDVCCKAVTSFREMEEMEENLILPTFRKLKFVDMQQAVLEEADVQGVCIARKAAATNGTITR